MKIGMPEAIWTVQVYLLISIIVSQIGMPFPFNACTDIF